ncbi:DUF4430 domain-containing protein [Vagococcus elongatus]|uniref:Transcobalamin-like C-terminal domain-containing protein n=1 Tax=Vagococcus elongatus TaxID=180344 RepID=A0A430B5R7_9ENTE|nr:DUF4430 domain-containing protein [Vagococcus elongatus]RSU15650.1 hypothetical protein CBF29_00825 [Vagococcus elongatus]
MKKKNLFLSLLCMTILFISACSTPKTTTESTPATTTEVTKQKQSEEEINVFIKIVEEDNTIADKELQVPSDSSLMSVMKENFDIVEEGGFITSVEGVEQKAEENFFWTYKINDEEVMTGAEDTILNEGDKVVFTYAQFK